MTSDHFLNGLAAYRNLFWPDFVEREGCVFLAFDETAFGQWTQQTGGDKRQIEEIMNHRHIVDLLPQAVEQPTRELVLGFGELLQELWGAKLLRDFPERRFTVS